MVMFHGFVGLPGRVTGTNTGKSMLDPGWGNRFLLDIDTMVDGFP